MNWLLIGLAAYAVIGTIFVIGLCKAAAKPTPCPPWCDIAIEHSHV